MFYVKALTAMPALWQFLCRCPIHGFTTKEFHNIPRYMYVLTNTAADLCFDVTPKLFYGKLLCAPAQKWKSVVRKRQNLTKNQKNKRSFSHTMSEYGCLDQPGWMEYLELLFVDTRVFYDSIVLTKALFARQLTFNRPRSFLLIVNLNSSLWVLYIRGRDACVCVPRDLILKTTSRATVCRARCTLVQN